jgi:predicted esterase
VRLFRLALSIVLASGGATGAAQPDAPPPAESNPALAAAFGEYWRATSMKDATKAAERIAALRPPFSAVYSALAEGRTYAAGVETGEFHWTTLPTGGVDFPTTIVVPEHYNPAVKYPVRVFLHGGVTRPAPDMEGDPSLRPRSVRRLPSPRPQIEAYPRGFIEAQWWFGSQIANLDEILARLKRVYNVDENRVHLMGVSDGGTGVFYVGLTHPTPFSALFAFNGSMRVLANPAVRAEGELAVTNLANRPLYVVNGLRDPLYPAPASVPYLALLGKAGGLVEFRPQNAAHDTTWWEAERERIEAWEEDHPRDPLPDRLSWRTDIADRRNRLHWLVIDRLAPREPASEGKSESLVDHNQIERLVPQDFGLRVDSSRGDGRKVVEVAKDTNAEAMGLKRGDLILEMGGARILSAGDIGRAFEAHPPGTPLRFVVDRKGARLFMEAPFPPAPKPATIERAFPRGRPAGRVDLVRSGNRVSATTEGVLAFTLLLSPDEFDFSAPIEVTVNGRIVFSARLEPDVATILKWNTRDDDRTMLFGAELRIVL